MKNVISLFIALSAVLLLLVANPAYSAIRMHGTHIAVATHHTVTYGVTALPHAKPDTGWKGIVSFCSAVAGIFVGGLILGTAAVIFGILGLGPKKKLKGLAIAGIILGVLDVIAVAVYLSTL